MTASPLMPDRLDAAAPPELRVAGLEVRLGTTGRPILHGVDITVAPGSVLGVVGESGSGKTTLLRCLLGAVAPGLEVSGSVVIADGVHERELCGASGRTLRDVRSRRIAYLAQDPAASLTPTMRIGKAIAERLPRPIAGRDESVRALLRSVDLPDDDDFVRRYPHALSGGQAQRVALARALAARPDVVLLDEPTTGLDVVTQAELLDELGRQQERTARTTVIVSHDLAVIARLADDLIVLRRGHIVERGPCRPTLRRPQHPYTQRLVDACPDPRSDPVAAPPPTAAVEPNSTAPPLQLRGLTATHRRRRRPPVVAARQLDLDVGAGECLALVGASGSGKSTIARTIVGAHRPDAGEVLLGGRTLAPSVAARRPADRFAIQLVPQNPTSSLNPRRMVGRAVADVVRRCRTGVDVDATVTQLLTEVGLDPALGQRRPGTLSGGERQRVAIARALAADPAVLICDEVTSSLDVSVQAGVVRLLRELVDDHGLAMLFITHDLGLVNDIADRVAVLDRGELCESGDASAVTRSPRHPVTRRLLAASPSLTTELERDARPAKVGDRTHERL